jgi:hypothetical protein
MTCLLNGDNCRPCPGDIPGHSWRIGMLQYNCAGGTQIIEINDIAVVVMAYNG